MLSVIVLETEVCPAPSANSFCRSLTERPRNTFFHLAVVENATFVVRILTISIIILDIQVLAI